MCWLVGIFFRRGQHNSLFLNCSRLIQQKSWTCVVQQGQDKEIRFTVGRALHASRHWLRFRYVSPCSHMRRVGQKISREWILDKLQHIGQSMINAWSYVCVGCVAHWQNVGLWPANFPCPAFGLQLMRDR